MNQAAPVTKTVQIQEKLAEYWKSNVSINEFEFKLMERDIKSIPDLSEMHSTLAMLYATQDKRELSIQHFEKALSLQFNITTITNYSVILGAFAFLKEQKDLLYEYKDYLNSTLVLKLFMDIAAMFYDIEMVEFANNKIKTISDSEFITDAFAFRKQQVIDIKEITNCSAEQINKLIEICSAIIKNNNKKLINFEIKLIAGGHFVFGVNSLGDNYNANLDDIVDMNFELADTVARTPELDDCLLTAVFAPGKRIQHEHM